MITAFTTDATWDKTKGFYFAPNELKELYSDRDIIHYKAEKVLTYNGSKQAIASVVAKKT